MKTPSRHTSRRARLGRPLALIGAVALIATVAQVAGVSGVRGHHATVNGTRIATLAGAPVPDVGSTKLASVTVKVAAGTTLRVSGRAHIVTDKIGGSGKTGQGVCGISYSRDGDPSWNLGTPAQTLALHKGKLTNSSISRSFAAPATDTYRFQERCHVATPASGTQARGTGVIEVNTGLPKGAAKPRTAAKH